MVSTEAEASVVLTDDDEVRELNSTYRGIGRTTDVLSFALAEDGADFSIAVEPGMPLLLGDVIVSVEQAARQAPDADLVAELTRLIVHGACHLVGHDHQTAVQTTRMQRAETELLDRFGLTAALTCRVHE